MASSRTGTAKWIRVRDKALANARDAGLTRCPLCGIWLDWDHSRRPNSPEADHITPHSQGGQDTIENVRIICRLCNQRLGGALGRRRAKRIQPLDLDASPIW